MFSAETVAQFDYTLRNRYDNQFPKHSEAWRQYDNEYKRLRQSEEQKQKLEVICG